jgi:hypothetical protein
MPDERFISFTGENKEINLVGKLPEIISDNRFPIEFIFYAGCGIDNK